VKIHVMSNGLPQKCFYSPDRDLVEQNIQISVVWNIELALDSCTYDSNNK
jgi:hypothetical protein